MRSLHTWPMSANLDLVRSIYAAWERGDFSSAEWADPEIEYVIADGPSPGRWTGLTGMSEGQRDFLGAWEDLRVEAEEYRELDGERVLVLAHNTGRGKASGLELGQMQTRGAVLFHLRSGTVIRVAAYFDRERALADLGLAREADAADSP
jgi:ketosteroid isomerase-like protein